jgi:hypothetical protein
MQSLNLITSQDNYSYYKVENVHSYKHENFSSYTYNKSNAANSSVVKNYYLILDTAFSDAFFHWIAECVIFFPLFIELKKDFPTLQIICKTKQEYHAIIGKYFGIESNDIIYEIQNKNNNICFFPEPITSLNNRIITDKYIQYSRTMVKYFNKVNISEKDIDILLLPRQTQNNKNESGKRVCDCSDIINKIPNITIFNTDEIRDLIEQIQIVKRAKTVIVTDGSSYLFNGLFSENATIIVLGNIVCSQIDYYGKMQHYESIIKSNNKVIYIPYLHGNFDNNKFLFDDICASPESPFYVEKKIHNEKKYSIVIPTRGSGDAYKLFINYAIPLYKKNLIENNIFEFIIVCPEINKQTVIHDMSNSNFNLNLKVYSDTEIINPNYCNNIGWCKQMIVKLGICKYIQTEHYFIIDDDMFLLKKLSFDDFFESSGKIYYSYEAYSDNSNLFQNNIIWLEKSCSAIGGNLEELKKDKNIMGVTPQLFINKIVKELIHYLGDNWEQFLVRDIATEFQLYWQFLKKTNRTHLYNPDNRFFKMDDSVHLLHTSSYDEISKKIKKNYEQKNFFIVLQSHLKVPYAILSHALESVSQ